MISFARRTMKMTQRVRPESTGVVESQARLSIGRYSLGREDEKLRTKPKSGNGFFWNRHARESDVQNQPDVGDLRETPS